MSAFEKLDPAVQHHVVNSLGWRSLRPLQDEAIDPILAGDHALLIAPTAGGKTEAAVLPLLSRMVNEDWRGLTVLYVCPIKALLNNLDERLRGLSELLGRRVALWHGDVGPTRRARILSEPPDILLTTPESIEVMLTSPKGDPRRLFSSLRAVVVDELHDFAGDDRGWHLLAVLERVRRIAGRDIQRLGLSATLGNPEDLLRWLKGSSSSQGRVIQPAEEASTAPSVGQADVKLDYVGGLENAATVISRLHRGERRLVFCDSRARVEKLSAELRALGVNTFVSHSSLSADERTRAERAFSEEANAVIVSTSTLELGIDLGRLDRVIQIDAPSTVASFLQRLGRSGRREGASRNCLLLATNEHGFLRAIGVLDLWLRGYVEPIEPPPLPYHILAQQIMALALQERGIGRHTWREWLGGMPAFSQMEPETVERIIDYMTSTGVLFGEEGILSLGQEGERRYGFRNFMDLMAVFASDPLFHVRHGRTDLGMVHPLSFLIRSDERPVLLLAGRSWLVRHVDWASRVAYVESTRERGRSQWLGSGQALHLDLCRAVRRVLAGRGRSLPLTPRGEAAIDEARRKADWIDDESTQLVRHPDGSLRWWTFAGLRANAVLAKLLSPLATQKARPENLAIKLEDHASFEDVERKLSIIAPNSLAAPIPVTEDALAGLKFSKCLPPAVAVTELQARLQDERGAAAAVADPVRFVHEDG